MSTLQEMLQGLQMFQTGVSQAVTGYAINQANSEVNKINEQITDEGEKRQALQGLANNLALRLTGSGASGTQIQAAFNAVNPQNFGSFEQLGLEGQLSGNKQYQGVASNHAKAQAQAGRQSELFKHQLDMEKLGVQASLKAQGDRAKPLESTELEKLSILGETSIAMDEMIHKFNTLDDKTLALPRTGLGSTGIPFVSPIAAMITPERQELHTMAKLISDKYRQMITGAGASDKELLRLEASLPNAVDDSPSAFITKAKLFAEQAKKIEQRRMRLYEAAGRNMGEVMSDYKARKAQEASDAESTNTILKHSGF